MTIRPDISHTNSDISRLAALRVAPLVENQVDGRPLVPHIDRAGVDVMNHRVPLVFPVMPVSGDIVIFAELKIRFFLISGDKGLRIGEG